APKPSPSGTNISGTPKATPSMCGTVRRKPKFAADAVTMTLFGPGVSDIDTVKGSTVSAKLIQSSAMGGENSKRCRPGQCKHCPGTYCAETTAPSPPRPGAPAGGSHRLAPAHTCASRPQGGPPAMDFFGLVVLLLLGLLLLPIIALAS